MNTSIGPDLLLVEDEPLVRMGLSEACERAGFQVVEARDGVEAIAILSLNPQIRLVVSDIDMPRMNGLELTRAIQRDYRSIGVVLISGKTFLRAGDFPSQVPFFEKPVEEQALISCLKRLDQETRG